MRASMPLGEILPLPPSFKAPPQTSGCFAVAEPSSSFPQSGERADVAGRQLGRCGPMPDSVIEAYHMAGPCAVTALETLFELTGSSPDNLLPPGQSCAVPSSLSPAYTAR